MDLCTVETGLLKKKPCGEKAVTKCANCERVLCVKHAVPQMSAGHKTFLCSECAKAWKQSEKTVGTLPSTPAAMVPPAAAKKPAEAVKPAAAPAARAPAAPAAKAAPVQKKSQPPPVEDSGPLEFTTEPKKPDDKK
jgi:hypothetical protein